MPGTIVATWTQRTKTRALIRFNTGDLPPNDTTLGLFQEELDVMDRPHWEQTPGRAVKDEDWLEHLETVKGLP